MCVWVCGWVCLHVCMHVYASTISQHLMASFMYIHSLQAPHVAAGDNLNIPVFS